ncbi:MAG: hypothetical protein K6T80_02215 [Firmicutes bacterium]|nr:hypothetical protein [Bacillota bacterium]
MSKTAKIVLRLAGIGLMAGGAFGGLPGPLSWGLMFLGLGAIVFSGGFG